MKYLTKYEMLAKAITIAVLSHEGQLDKAGKPYILHPMHVSAAFPHDPELAAIGILHDVLEDDPFMTADILRKSGMSERIVQALLLLTHEKGVSYEDYIEAIATSLDATLVKRQDLKHNSDITRLKGVSDKDLKRVAKYHRAYIRLTEAKRSFTRAAVTIDVQRLRNLTTARLHTKMEHIYKDLEMLTGQTGLMTHMLPQVLELITPWLKEHVKEAEFWDGEYRPELSGEYKLLLPTEHERKDIFE